MVAQIEVQTTSEQFVSTWSGKTYTRWLRNGRMVGCSCPWHANRPHVDCKHAIQYNSERQAITTIDLVPHVEDELRSQYEGCDYCGCNHKFWNCPF